MILVAHYSLELYQIYMKITFLNENLEEEVYMHQPKGFLIKGKKHMIVKLRNQYIDLNKIFNNDILSLMILYIFLDLKKYY